MEKLSFHQLNKLQGRLQRAEFLVLKMELGQVTVGHVQRVWKTHLTQERLQAQRHSHALGGLV